MGGCAWSCLPLCCFGNYSQYAVYSEKGYDHTPSCWPCAATGLYMRMPSAYNRDAARADAAALRDAMKGCGTDEAQLVRLLMCRTPGQIALIKECFQKEFGNGKSLEQWIKDDTSGDFRNVLLMSVCERGERDARLVKSAVEFAGTEDDWLRYLLCTSHQGHLRAMEAAYMRIYNKSMVQDVRDDTSFNYKQLLTARCKQAEYVAERLRKAIERPGTDDSRLIRILAGYPRSNRILKRILASYDDVLNTGIIEELEREAYKPDLQDIKEAYQRLYGRALAEDISSDTSGNFGKMLRRLLADPADSLADDFNECLEGKGTNDNMLIELAATRSNHELQEAAVAYERKYGRPLIAAVKGDTSGDYFDTLEFLLRPHGYSLAVSLHNAYSGPGTDDDITASIFTQRSRREIREMMEQYQKKYGKSMEKATRSETSFWYRRALVYAIRMASEPVVLVPQNQLVRLRDV